MEIQELTDKLGTLSKQMTDAIGRMEESKATDTARWHEADAARTAIAAELTAVKGQLDAAQIATDHEHNVAEAKALLESIRMPSKAAAIGSGPAIRDNIATPLFGQGYVKGTLVSALAALRGNDPDAYRTAKATLDTIGVRYADVPESSKATLGSTSAAGGYVLPNNLVDTLIKPNVQEAFYQELLTVRTGVTVRGIDQPYRTGAPLKMVVQAWGATKENVDEAYGSYTATLYTIARIYDIGKQYLRFSAGSAEEDVMDELSKAAGLGENYYTMFGSGSSEPLGIVTALQAAPADKYKVAHTASATTLAGSMATALSKLAGALAGRSQPTTAFVVNAADYWTMASQGTDTAGFFFAPFAGPTGIRPGTLMTPWGIPVYHDANLTSKMAVAGNWKACKFFRGLEFRVESSDQAGTRWDTNLVGFRGEEEIGINAASAVTSGAFAYSDTVLP